jgi:ABC-type multidrug transport system fused ATPase/permease subunit
VAENIAFGYQVESIDYDLVKTCAKLAEISDFIENDLLSGYKTIIGDRGIRLSGGQRQRLGIARALYSQPTVLVLDEATSALDVLTENRILTSIRNMKRDLTVILITHRLKAVKNCDNIIFLKDGNIMSQGDFQSLIEENKIFRSMVDQSED